MPRISPFRESLWISPYLLILSCISVQVKPLTVRADSAAGIRHHVVQLGAMVGNKFVPDTLVANVGDSVTFQMDDTSLSISQSENLTDPCGSSLGFSSVPGEKKYTIRINDMKPILMNCPQNCHMGMVMIINPGKASDIATMSRAASQDLPPQPGGDSLDSALPPLPQPGPPTAEASVKGNTPGSTAPESSVSPVVTGGPRTTPISPAPGSEKPGGRPRQHTRRIAVAAAAAALALCGALVAGAWYMWRRRMKRTARLRDAGRWVDFSAAQTDDASARKGCIMAAPTEENDSAGDDSGITPFTPPGRTGLLRWKTKMFGAGGRAGHGDGDSNVADGAAGAAIAHLQAELGRVLAENELLRQRVEPPAYSDGARSVIEGA